MCSGCSFHRAEELEETDNDANAPVFALEMYDLDVVDVNASHPDAEAAQVTSHDGERSEYAAPNASKRAQTRGCAVATAPGPIFEVPSQLETVMQ